MQVAAIAVAGLLLAPAAAEEHGYVDLPRFPSISPDGSEVVFSWGGDLWRVPAEGGRARRLTRHVLDDLHSSWSPDGQWIVFTSMRDGYLNLWRIHRDGTRISQLTYSDRFLRHPHYAREADGTPVITFSALLEADVYRGERPYAIAPHGGEHRRLHDAFGSEPRLSPDGRRVAFTRGGHYHDWNRRGYRGPDARNVWIHDRGSDSFKAVTGRDGDDGRAQWAGNDELIFMSDRELGTVNLYRVRPDDDERIVERLTAFEERGIEHFDVSHDGSTAVLHVWDTLYTLDLQTPGATPRPLRIRAGEDGHDDYALRRIERDVTEAALSPDGKVMAYIAYGRVYVRHIDPHSPTHAVTPKTHARHRDLAWSPDGLCLYFTNDADGTSSIYQARVVLTREEVRRTPAGPPPEPPRALVAAPLVTGELPETVALLFPQEPPRDSNAGLQTEDPEDPFGPADPVEPVTPPDPADPVAGEPPQEPPAEPERAPDEAFGPDYAEGLPPELDPARWHEAVRFSVRPLVQTEHNDRDVAPSPDGRSIAFRRGRGDLAVMDLNTGDTRTLVEGWDSSLQFRWSPDSRYIAYSQNDLNFSANIFIVPVDGSREPINITRHPRNDLNPRWSADGRVLTFISNRSGDSYDLYRMHLDSRLYAYSPREHAAYYREARAAAAQRQPAPVRPPGERPAQAPERPVLVPYDDLDDAWRRVERVTASPAHVFANEMTPAGDRYVFHLEGEGLVVTSWDGSDRTRIGPGASVQHLTLSGDHVVYVSAGRAGIVSLAGGEHQRPDISGRIRINLRAQALQKFREAARAVEEGFYRPDMKGLDWPALVKDYERLIVRARTASEFSDVANRLMGELGVSHTGVSNPGPGSALREPSGRLGFEYEHVALDEESFGYRVTAVVPEGPAAHASAPLQPGDVITRIDFEPFGPEDSLLRALRGRAGQEVVVDFERRVRGFRTERQALITPVDFDALARLRYDAFRDASQRRVHELSDGRLGYLHIQAMNQTSLEGFQGDLYAAAHGKEGLIIDVRNNGGGNTTDRILASIMVAKHAYTVPAGADPANTGHYPHDRLDAPRYTLPINMLANAKSYSNAEILAHAFKTLGRGTLVGEQTYGGVISAGRHTLIDGATVRQPFRGWYLPDGTDMEHHGAVPDLRVAQTPEDEVADHDRQLERAVSDLLRRIDGE